MQNGMVSQDVALNPERPFGMQPMGAADAHAAYRQKICYQGCIKWKVRLWIPMCEVYIRFPTGRPTHLRI